MEVNSQGFVNVTIAEKVSKITFGHPHHNSLSSLELSKLSEVIQAEGENPDTAIILLQSQGDKTFCAGANFDELRSLQNMKDACDFFGGFARLILSIKTCGKLVIGRIQGKTVGGGVGLAAAMDYVMASESASVRLSELSIGIGPYVIEPAISRKIGKGHFSALALNPSGWQTASWAHQAGLYQQVFPNLTELDAHLEDYLKKMTEYSPIALKNLKSMLWENSELWQNLLIDRAAKSAQLLFEPTTQAMLRKL